MAIVPYFGTLTIPPGTTTTSPVSVEVVVAPGRLVKARLYVPPGPRGEISIWLNHLSHQLAPVPPHVYSQVDDDIIEVPLDYPVPVNSNRFTLYGISPNASFAHRVDIELLVDTSAILETAVSSQSLLERLSSFFD